MLDREAFTEECAVPVDAGDGKGLGPVANKFFLRFHQTLHQRFAFCGRKEKGIFRSFPVDWQSVAVGDTVDIGPNQRNFLVQPLRLTEKNDLSHFELQLTAAEFKDGFSAIAPPACCYDLRVRQNLPVIMRIGVVANRR